jgi:enoyl-CoA hydratase/carnithine racemase
MELTSFRAIHVPPALSDATVDTLAREIAAALDDESVPGLALRGTAGAFCRGMELNCLASGLPAEAGGGVRRFAASLVLLMQARKPTLAVVQGPALGGGLGLAAACDVVLAVRDSTFGLPEGLFGLTPAVIAPALLGRISPAALRRLALTALPIDAEAARTIGLVDEILDDEAALLGRLRRVSTALSRVHPRTKAVVNETARQVSGGSIAEAMKWGVEETLGAAQSPETAARVRRFMEGGAPWES